MDILPSELILSKIYEFDDTNSDGPMTIQLSQMGYESTRAIRNMGSTYIFLIANIGLLLIVCLFYLLRHVSSIFAKVYDFLKKKLLWGFFLRFFI